MIDRVGSSCVSPTGWAGTDPQEASGRDRATREDLGPPSVRALEGVSLKRPACLQAAEFKSAPASRPGWAAGHLLSKYTAPYDDLKAGRVTSGLELGVGYESEWPVER